MKRIKWPLKMEKVNEENSMNNKDGTARWSE